MLICVPADLVPTFLYKCGGVDINLPVKPGEKLFFLQTACGIAIIPLQQMLSDSPRIAFLAKKCLNICAVFKTMLYKQPSPFAAVLVDKILKSSVPSPSTSIPLAEVLKYVVQVYVSKYAHYMYIGIIIC